MSARAGRFDGQLEELTLEILDVGSHFERGVRD
jgi:hypothetical protein